MELYLKKYFWLLPLLVIVLCATFAASGTNHLLVATYLTSDDGPKPASRPRPPRVSERTPRPVASKDSEAVATRNVFCSTCDPPTPELPSAPSAASDPNHPPATSLPLALLATSVARRDRYSSATIANTQTQRSGSYFAKDEIPEAGEVVRIAPLFVDFQNKNAGRVERINLLGVAASAPVSHTPPPMAPPVASGGGEAELMAEIDRGVKKLDDTHYLIERSVVDKVLNDPTLLARSARIVPSIKDGKSNGFKMYAIRPSSIYSKIGLQNGDTIQAVNGFEITSPDTALQVYTKVKSASSLSIQVTRRGQPVTMDYTIK
jgi:general secretion pathway protein C